MIYPRSLTSDGMDLVPRLDVDDLLGFGGEEQLCDALAVPDQFFCQKIIFRESLKNGWFISEMIRYDPLM